MNWRDKPTCIENWDEGIDYIIFFDENGSPDLKKVRKIISEGRVIENAERYFTLTGCVIKRDCFPNIRQSVLGLKNKYWENGQFFYEKHNESRRICFHSREIRRKIGPFNERIINYDYFIKDLTDLIADCDIKLLSTTIDKQEHLNIYGERAVHPYVLSIGFIIERLSKYLLCDPDVTAAIIFEGRGKKEDKYLLKHTISMIENGTRYVSAETFDKIVGIYFNNKWCSDNTKSYLGLELADLCSHPIHIFTTTSRNNLAFDAIRKKIYGYPLFNGKGIKRFP